MTRITERPRLIAILGQTATGKSSLGLALAEKIGGEIISCDSTAVYKGFDIGTDKVPVELRRKIPHHLIDVADPSDSYSAATYAREAANAVHYITAKGKVPIIVGGTGLYYRALTRGLFQGPGRNDVIRKRLVDVSHRRGSEWLHRIVARVDPISAKRIHPRDEKRLVRALEVFFLTQRSLTAHFNDTRSLIESYNVVPFGLRLDASTIAIRVKERVARQFDRGLLKEVRGLLSRGISEDVNPFSGLVYRQVLEYLHGVRSEEETRTLIVKENQKYARRQLIWFRKEPNLNWIDMPGESPEALQIILRLTTQAR